VRRSLEEGGKVDKKMDDSFQNAAFLIATDENHGRT
jgi:hypothetical protein